MPLVHYSLFGKCVCVCIITYVNYPVKCPYLPNPYEGNFFKI